MKDTVRTKINSSRNKPLRSSRNAFESESHLTTVEKELLEEVNPDVVKYFKSVPYAMDPKVLYLSSIKHYIFDSETLSNVSSLINLRHLNKIAHVQYFLYNTNRMLPMNGYYLGCYENAIQQKKRLRSLKPGYFGAAAYMSFYFFHGLLAKIPGLRGISLLANSGRMRCLTTIEADTLLFKNGFLICDRSTIQGITYFVAQKVRVRKKENLRFLTLIFDYKNHSKIVKL